MPTYSYFCENCSLTFEHFFTIKDYQEKVPCEKCKQICLRNYIEDVLSQSTSVKKSDSELKTIGDLANRNRDKLSADQKTDLDYKHNSYKDQDLTKELPKGMSRIKKPNKIKWR
jgi:putative FmdB family regulatory protein